MGGDIVAGTNMVEALEFFEHDADTDAIILAGEVGGRAELDAAEWIKDYKQRSSKAKYISTYPGQVSTNSKTDRLQQW
jgi:succinyl-CoA synthetase alpha subunit